MRGGMMVVTLVLMHMGLVVMVLVVVVMYGAAVAGYWG